MERKFPHLSSPITIGSTVNARFYIFSMRKKYAIFNTSDRQSLHIRV